MGSQVILYLIERGKVIPIVLIVYRSLTHQWPNALYPQVAAMSCLLARYQCESDVYIVICLGFVIYTAPQPRRQIINRHSVLYTSTVSLHTPLPFAHIAATLALRPLRHFPAVVAIALAAWDSSPPEPPEPPPRGTMSVLDRCSLEIAFVICLPPRRAVLWIRCGRSSSSSRNTGRSTSYASSSSVSINSYTGCKVSVGKAVLTYQAVEHQMDHGDDGAEIGIVPLLGAAHGFQKLAVEHDPHVRVRCGRVQRVDVAHLRRLGAEQQLGELVAVISRREGKLEPAERLGHVVWLWQVEHSLWTARRVWLLFLGIRRERILRVHLLRARRQRRRLVDTA